MSEILNSLAGAADRLSNRLIWTLAPKPRRIVTERPVVSFTFDDVPDSALTEGAAILERHGARGTFYIAGGLEGRLGPDYALITRAGCLDLFRRGHEIGCHTFSHRPVRTHGSALAGDLDRNARYLAEAGIAARAANFAFPFNAAWFPARRELARRFLTARAGGEAVNRAAADPLMLKAVEIRQPEDHALGLTRWIDDVAANPGWLIFFTHDVGADPSPYGCRPATLDRLVTHAAGRGCEILTVAAAARRFGWEAGKA